MQRTSSTPSQMAFIAMWNVYLKKLRTSNHRKYTGSSLLLMRKPENMTMGMTTTGPMAIAALSDGADAPTKRPNAMAQLADSTIASMSRKNGPGAARRSD